MASNGSDSDDDSSVEISDVDLSDDESGANSTIPSGDEGYHDNEGVLDERQEYYDGGDDDEDIEYGDDTALLLVKEEKFFERLNHFMDVQKKIEERMQKIDTKGRMKEIDVVSHSGGILDDDGTSCFSS